MDVSSTHLAPVEARPVEGRTIEPGGHEPRIDPLILISDASGEYVGEEDEEAADDEREDPIHAARENARAAIGSSAVSLDTRFVLRDEGIHIPPERGSTDLKRNRHLVDEADLILAMTRQQVDMLRAAFPEASDKEIYTLKEFAGGHGDIEDPSGRDEDFFAACRDEIKACLERAIGRLAPE